MVNCVPPARLPVMTDTAASNSPGNTGTARGLRGFGVEGAWLPVMTEVAELKGPETVGRARWLCLELRVEGWALGVEGLGLRSWCLGLGVGG